MPIVATLPLNILDVKRRAATIESDVTDDDAPKTIDLDVQKLSIMENISHTTWIMYVYTVLGLVSCG